MSYKLGSLFDGSGGFPLSGTLCGIEPMWAAEVEPYPISVTRSRFPNMKHLGDISKVNGGEIEPVDIITFGSPCQDLSVAGKRAGLKHEANGDDETTRSGLFMEAVRIIKEMRKATNGKHPRFAVWENVPGAFSSNNGEDFRIVLEELIKIVEPTAVMPAVPKKGWAYADNYIGDGWSLAYRVFDAQYWGVPQRRRRIYLVADFRGGCAEEILFERESLRGYFTESGTPWQAVAADAERSVGADDREGELPYTLKIRSGCEGGGKGALIQEDKSATLACNNDQYLFQPVGADPYNGDLTGDKMSTLGVNCGMSTGRNAVAYGISSYESNAMKSSNPHSGVYEADTSRTLDLNGGNPACNQGGIAIVEGFDAYNQVLTGDKAKTLNSAASDADHVPCTVYSVENHPADSRVNLDESGKVQTLTSRMGTGGGNVPMVMEPFCKSRRAQTADDATTWKHGKVANTLNTFDQGEARVNELVVHAVDTTHGGEPVIAYGLDRASFNQGENAKFDFSILDEQQPTLTARGPGAVCYTDVSDGVAYSFDPGASRDVGVLFIEECGKTLTNGTCPGHHDGVVIARPTHSMTTGSFMQVNEEISPTLAARDYKDPTCVDVYDTVTKRYIVRRLTPTECARLQGFPDKWGHIEPKNELTEDEYHFWLEVRKTHDAINGRAVKDYNEKQMLTYYNKLWTDSAEYKMWGNGIALPCALYVLQGIKEALVNEQVARSKWLDDLLNN